MMKRTFGAPGRARFGAGHAGFDTSNVRPMTPGNAWPGLYSLSAMFPSLRIRSVFDAEFFERDYAVASRVAMDFKAPNRLVNGAPGRASFHESGALLAPTASSD